MDLTNEKTYESYLKEVYKTDELPQNKKVLVSFIEMQKNIIINAINTILQLSNDPQVVQHLNEVSTKEKLTFIKLVIGELDISLRTQNVFDSYFVGHYFDDTTISNDLIKVNKQIYH